jgi:hypothetical protein
MHDVDHTAGLGRRILYRVVTMPRITRGRFTRSGDHPTSRRPVIVEVSDR